MGSKGHGSALDLSADRGQAPGLEHLDGAGPPADDARDLVQGQPADDPEQHDVALVGREPFEDPPDAVDQDALHRVGFGISAGAHASEVVGRRGHRGTSLAPARPVDHDVPGDREDPGAERGFVSFEPIDRTDDVQVRVAEDVVGIGDAASAEVSVERPGGCAVELAPRPVTAGARGRQEVLDGAIARDGGLSIDARLRDAYPTSSAPKRLELKSESRDGSSRDMEVP